MKTVFFISVNLFLSFIILSCKNNPVSPNDITPGRRDYVWDIDTVNYPSNPMFRMWGSSSSDVWAITGSNWDKSISHYDGKKWSSYGVERLTSPSSIYGFSNNYIFIGAANGQIWKYNGYSWIFLVQLTKDGHDRIVFDNIWGSGPSNIFAVGAYPDAIGYNNSVIAHFNNNEWEMINTDGLYGIVEHLYQNYSDNKIYIQVIGGVGNYDSTKIYEFSNGSYIKLYGNVWTKGLQADISIINKEVYFVLGNKIATRVDNEFRTILEVDNPHFYQRIWGRNSKDIFLLMTDGLVHYNGTDTKYLFYFRLAEVKPWTQIYGAALFEKEAFFLAYEPTTGLNLIYHGILK